jgi:hypothetical protein
MAALRVASTTVAVLLLLAHPAFAGKRRAARKPAPDVLTLSVSAVRSAGAAIDVLDFGVVSWRPIAAGGVKDATRVQRTVIVHARRTSGIEVGTATLRAWIDPSSPCTVRVNGVWLTPVPQVVDPRLEVGKPRTFVVQMDLPVTAEEGAFATGVEWEVSEN